MSEEQRSKFWEMFVAEAKCLGVDLRNGTTVPVSEMRRVSMSIATKLLNGELKIDGRTHR